MRKMIRVVGPLAICLMFFAGFEAAANPGKGKGKNKHKGNKPAVIIIQPDDHGGGHSSDVYVVRPDNHGGGHSSDVYVVQPAVNHGHGKARYRARGRGHHAVSHHGGPPPWAPAHGYRSQHRHGVQAAYVAPYGIAGGSCNRKEVGLILGAVTGGLIGSKLTSKKDRAAGIIGGAILGAIVGSSVGKSMDKADHHCVGQTLEHAPDNQMVTWRDPDRGMQYQVTPVQTYQTANGGYCREYQTISTVNGRSQETYGTACRQDDGAWKMMN